MLRKRPIAIELRLRAEAEIRKESERRFMLMIIRFLTGVLALGLLIVIAAVDILAKEDSLIIEEILGDRQLEKVISEVDYVAVFWYSKNNKYSDEILIVLENLNDDVSKCYGVKFVKINNKRFARSFGITKVPALSLFVKEEIVIYNGDLEDDSRILDFLTDKTSLSIPNRIEQISRSSLFRIVESEQYVAALIYNDERTSKRVLSELEKIDDEADVFSIRILRIQYSEIIRDFSLTSIPSLVYFRHTIPLIYDGDLEDEKEVLEWLIYNQSSVHDEDVVEDVSEKELSIMIENMDHVLVLFHDNKRKSQKALYALENIDDECDQIGVSFVQILDNEQLIQDYNIQKLPQLILFINKVPHIYKDDIGDDSEDVYEWIMDKLSYIEEIFEVNVLQDKLRAHSELAVLFIYKNDENYDRVIRTFSKVLEKIDDFVFVRVYESQIAKFYGIQQFPTLALLLREGKSDIYDGDLTSIDNIILWFTKKMILKKLIARHDNVIASYESNVILNDLPDKIKFIEIENYEAKYHGIHQSPSLVYFKNRVPIIYNNSCEDVKCVTNWINNMFMNNKNIPEVSKEILNSLIRNHDYVAILILIDQTFDLQRVLRQEFEELILVQTSANILPYTGPSFVLFQKGSPTEYPGGLKNSKKLIKWLKKHID